MDICRNITFSVAVINYTSFPLETIGDKLVGVEGKEFNILQELASKMHFEYRLVTPDDGLFGVCDDNGMCTGMIGTVTRHQADMAISSISYTPSRAKYVDFSCPYIRDEIIIATKNVDAYYAVNSVFFAEPLRRKLWILLASLLIVLFAVIKIMEHSKILKEKFISVQTMLRIILRQDINLERSGNNLLVVMTLLLFVVTAGCTCKLYECMLTSAASLTPVIPPIDTIEDMVDAIRTRDYVVISLPGNHIQKIIMTSKDGSWKIFAESSLKPNFVAPTSAKESIAMLLNGKMARVESKRGMTMELIHMKLPVETLHFSKEYLSMDYIAIVLRKNFPCKDDLNKWLNILASVGLIEKWESDQMKSFNQNRTSIDDGDSKYIGLNELKVLFFILLSGLLTGFVVLLMEVIYKINSM